ncbi:hypothetical protein E2562_023920 [Oryza meyeriana var. granulata]|uniref:AMP-binding enzyme C-terminal domain-containing protein n=1 Tax=Oryza meyeriana var. granulata TaxID=110450 RepID=A0A6G1BYS2_9ORYZ|nr:hypothetical protein E2562_023920 [Oryza meyeriana var. granulata]
MAPKTVVFDELPKTSTGKTQKFVLREKARAMGSLAKSANSKLQLCFGHAATWRGASGPYGDSLVPGMKGAVHYCGDGVASHMPPRVFRGMGH